MKELQSSNQEFAYPPLMFARPESGRFQIGKEALSLLHSYAQDNFNKPEAGGVLLERHIIETDDIVIDLATGPLWGDRCSRLKFSRARRLHQEAIDRAWQESGGSCTYLGEWHTHPELNPSPSLIDRLEWERKLVMDKFAEPIFFVIVGTAHLCVWEGQRHKGLIQLIESKN